MPMTGQRTLRSVARPRRHFPPSRPFLRESIVYFSPANHSIKSTIFEVKHAGVFFKTVTRAKIIFRLGITILNIAVSARVQSNKAFSL
jgi:hypothetical protein